MNAFARPQTLQDALSLLGSGRWQPLAGGTDIYPGMRQSLPGQVLDLTAIKGLSGISGSDDLRIGACTTWSELATAKLPPAARALQQAALMVGGRQIQNAGTIGGNLCNASPAADGVPPLLALDARVELASPRGTRQLALPDFLLGPRRTARAPDELLTAVILPAASLAGGSAFVKLGARAYLVISIAMVAARLSLRDGRISAAALAVGACSATARRLPEIEAALTGLSAASAGEAMTEAAVARALSPIDDVRATASYRTSAATHLLRRAVAEALQ
jgi:CO/xanthine dehydrogenase FAD-binding subunit